MVAAQQRDEGEREAHTPRLVLIAALDRERAIGRGNALPWHLPDDLKRFKALTLGQPVLMGRRTAEAIGRALPGRANLVLTRAALAPLAGMQAVGSLDEAVARARDAGASSLAVIGGGEVYALALPRADAMALTHVDTVVEAADAFFPPFEPRDWRITARQAHAADARHAFAFEFIDYVRAR